MDDKNQMSAALKKTLYISKILNGLLIVCFVVTGCNFQWVKDLSVERTSTSVNNANVDLEITWAYRDEGRLGIEILVKNYPLAQEATLQCPITRIDLENGGKSYLLYKNPDQISLNEFYKIKSHNNWHCAIKRHQGGFADYLFSLTHFNEDRSLPDGTNYFQNDPLPELFDSSVILIELGQVNALFGPQSMATLPFLGSFTLDVKYSEIKEKLTWQNSQKFIGDSIVIQVNRVALNPSVTWLNACIMIPDNHNWIPKAKLESNGYLAYSTDYLLTYPVYPSTSFVSDQRCFIFTIPYSYSIGSPLSDFHIGINQVIIDNTNPGQVEMKDCEAVSREIRELKSIQIYCWKYETNGQPQHWFQVVSYPDNMTYQEAYDIVETAFTNTIVGPWMLSIDFQPAMTTSPTSHPPVEKPEELIDVIQSTPSP